MIEIKPDAAKAYLSRGMAYANKGDYDTAIKNYTKAIEIDPELREIIKQFGLDL